MRMPNNQLVISQKKRKKQFHRRKNTNRANSYLELLFLTVFALPKASRTGFD
jgi:hypothetical protein